MNNKFATVVIPAKNEERCIAKIVKLVKSNKRVNQVIVVDNNSEDSTAKIAQKAGADVVFCENRGKGYAMEAGLKCVENDVVAFVDADINNYSKNIINVLVNPILNDDVDFVKSMFERKGGRVTELVAKPLLNITYPDMYKFAQPLSGMIAGKTELFKKIEFEKDYGVDIGILLDMIKLNAKIVEVSIGKIKNSSKHWQALNKMAEEVANAILKRRYK